LEGEDEFFDSDVVAAFLRLLAVGSEGVSGANVSRADAASAVDSGLPNDPSGSCRARMSATTVSWTAASVGALCRCARATM
jgi:hypothetical protein